ncbi:hypothetical protein [uncultured Ruegeria sp.]|uniref:hypothetical protein n=1 Tax=uncultured Ruegeria sp. TaxID=259304 RepID=UPI0026017672|nr:hypothetical protein [uncultured Ruegeria sp.]
MPEWKRVDAKYCKEGCRKMAARKRHQKQSELDNPLLQRWNRVTQMAESNTLAAPTNPAAATELASSMQKTSNLLSFILLATPSLVRRRAI